MNTLILGKRYELIGSVILASLLVFVFSVSLTHAQDATTDSPIIITDVSVTSTIDTTTDAPAPTDSSDTSVTPPVDTTSTVTDDASNTSSITDIISSILSSDETSTITIEDVGTTSTLDNTATADATTPSDTPTEDTSSTTTDETVATPDTPSTDASAVEEVTPAPEAAPTSEVGAPTESVGEVLGVTTEVLTPTLSTDKADYHPGETASIFGRFFSSLQNIVLRIFGGSAETEDYVESSETLSADENGSFNYDYQLDNFYRPIYTVIATAFGTGEELARTTFTDAGPGVNLDQCHNGSLANITVPCDDTSPNPKWENGNINSGNSQYREGDGIPYHLAITGLTDGTWTVRLQYDFTKAGIYAIDRLTSYGLTQSSDPCAGVSGCVLGNAIPIDIPGDVAGPFSATQPQLPNSGNLDIAGTANTLNAADKQLAVWEYTSGGNVVAGPVDSIVTQSGLATGDSSREFQFQITVSECPTSTNCRVMVGWTGHIASQIDWGTGKGAASISGAPAHMRVLGVDHSNGTSGGNQDRSFSTSAIVPPQQTATLTLVKNVVNDSGGDAAATEWTLSASGPTNISGTTGGASITGATVTAGTYTLTESNGPSGYAAGGWSCLGGGTQDGNNITLAAGDTVTCTITNNDIPPSLTITKTVVNDNGGTAVAAGFQGKIDDVNVDWDTPKTTTVGAHTASETNLPGYTAGAWGGDCATNGTITLAIGDNKTCTITNDDQPAEIHGTKFNDLDGDGIKDSGEPGLSGWTINVSGTASASTVTDSNGDYAFSNLSVGTYTVTETNQTGWTQTTANPAPVVLVNGQMVIGVNFGNFELASITGRKFEDVNGNGSQNSGESNLSGWTVRLYSLPAWTLVDSEVTDSGGVYTFTGLAKGEYKVCEVMQSGWTQTNPTFTNNNGSPSSSEEGQKCRTANITTSGQIHDGNIFGNFKLAKIVVHKNVLNPDGGEVVDAHTFTVQSNGAGNQTIAEGTDATYDNLVPGTYVITELTDADYDPVSVTPSSVTPTSGQTVDVSVVNKQKKATITVVKDVVAPDETAVSDTHGFSVTLNSETKPFAENSNASFTVNPDTYSAVEGADANYTFVSDTGAATVGSNGSATITIKNKQNLSHLIVIKHVENNNGGNAVAGNFTMSVSGTNASQTSFAGVESPGTDVKLWSGPYNADETAGPSGYAKTLGTDCSGTIGVGETKTCTITNDDIQPTLTVNKVLVPVEDTGLFNLTINGQTAGTGANVGDGGTTGAVGLDAGTYTVGETAGTNTSLGGYTSVISGDCNPTDGKITLSVGDEKTCTITNMTRVSISGMKFNDANQDGTNDSEAGLPNWEIVAMQKIGELNVGANGTTANSPVLVSGEKYMLLVSGTADAGDGIIFDVDYSKRAPNTFWTDYVQNYASYGDTLLDLQVDGSSANWGTYSTNHTYWLPVTGTGASLAFTVYDVYYPNNTGSLNVKIYKVITSDTTDVNGDYSLEVNGYTGDIVIGEVTQGGWSQTYPTGGSHTVSGAGGDIGDKDFGNTQLGVISGYKFNDLNGNGAADTGEPTLSGWTISLSGNASGSLVTDATGKYEFPNLVNGIYSLAETLVVGWTQKFAPSVATIAAGTDSGGNNFGNFKNVTIKAYKFEDKNGDGDKDTEDTPIEGWGMTLNDGQAQNTDANGMVSWTVNTGGDYTVAEETRTDWTNTTPTSVLVSVASGDADKIVEFLNYEKPTLTLVKTVTNDNGGTKQVADFALKVDDTSVTSGSALTTVPGAHTASETGLFGYAPSAWGGNCAADGTITLLSGDDKTCTITNDDIQPKLHLIKNVKNDNGGLAEPTDFTLTADGTKANNDFSGTGSADSGATAQIDTWTLSETGPAGYLASDWVCTGGGTQNGNTITLGIGEEATCTITNDDTPGHFTGGGSIFPNVSLGAFLSGVGKNPKDTRVTHGFTLHCDPNRLPNRLEINWGPAQNAQKFHLLTLDSAFCTDNTAINPQQPNADMDTITGKGTGRFQAGKSKEVNATVEFTFDDAGEPGKNDRASIIVRDSNGVIVLNTAGMLNLNMGNQQAHQDN